MEEEKKESVLSFATADELTTFLMDLQGQIVNLQETIDKMNPVEEAEPTEDTEDTPAEETPTEEEAPTEEELSEIDALLQK